MKHNNIIFGVFAVVVLAVVGYTYVTVTRSTTSSTEVVACPADAFICPDGSSVLRTGPSCSFAECPPDKRYKDETIVINTPLPNETVTSPFTMTGEARGTYFYEGTFPIYVTNKDGYIIGESTAIPQGEWATESFVPFTATISYSLPPDSPFTEGTIMLQNDNVSGIPDSALMREIPITFGERQ